MKYNTQLVYNAQIVISNYSMVFYLVTKELKKKLATIKYYYQKRRIRDDRVHYDTFYELTIHNNMRCELDTMEEAFEKLKCINIVIPDEAVDEFKSNCILARLAAA